MNGLNGIHFQKTIKCQFKVNYAHPSNRVDIKYANRFKRSPNLLGNYTESLILAQNERWRRG